MSLIKQIPYGTEKVVSGSYKDFSIMTFPDILTLNDFNFCPDFASDDFYSIYLLLCAQFTALRQLYDDFKGKRAVGLVGCCLRNQMYLVRNLICEQCRYLSFHHYIKPSDYKRISYYLNSLDDAIMVRVLESEALAENES